MTAVTIPDTQSDPPGPKWCGTVLRCACGNPLTAARAVTLPERKAIQCGNCKTVIDGKAMEGKA